MPTYRYKAKDHAGKTVAGNLEAESDHAAAKALRDQGLWPLSIEAARGAAPAPPAPAPSPAPTNAATQTTAPPRTAPAAVVETSNLGGVSLKDLAVFFRQFGATVHSGMPLTRCASLMREQSRGSLAVVAAAIENAVSQGQPLSTAFARYPRVFSPLVVAMLRAGEVGGNLDGALARIADLTERQYALNQKIRQQTFYPKLILGAGVLIGVGVKVVLAGITGNAGGGPAIGGLLMPAACLAVGGLVLSRLVGRFGRNNGALDGVKLSLPVFGRVTRQLATARFSRAFAGLYRAGVGTPEALEIAADASGNRCMAETLRRALPSVQRGERLSVALAPLDVLSGIAAGMLHTGEETGNIDEMLDKVADYAETESETAIRQMVVILEPALIFLLAILVAVEAGRFYLGTVMGPVNDILNSME